MILQLNPAIPLDTLKGKAICHFLIDYGIEEHLYWVCFINDTGECWTFANPEIRAQKNVTVGRTSIKDYHMKANQVKLLITLINAVEHCIEDMLIQNSPIIIASMKQEIELLNYKINRWLNKKADKKGEPHA